MVLRYLHFVEHFKSESHIVRWRRGHITFLVVLFLLVLFAALTIHLIELTKEQFSLNASHQVILITETHVVLRLAFFVIFINLWISL